MPLYINEAYAKIYANDTKVHTSHKDKTVVRVKLQNSSTDFKYLVHFTQNVCKLNKNVFYVNRKWAKGPRHLNNAEGDWSKV